MVLLDSSTIEFNSLEEFLALEEDEENYLVDFVYPISVVDEEGEASTVNNIEELSDIFISCIPDSGWTGGWEDGGFPVFDIDFENSCFQLIYPITVVNLDQEEQTVDNEAALASLVASSEDIYFFQFPIGVTLEDGETLFLESSEDLFEAFLLCDDFSNPCDTLISGGGQIACYELDFPVSLLLDNGTVVVANDEDEFYNYFFEGNVDDFKYPITLIDEDGEAIIVKSEEEFEEALALCFDGELLDGLAYLLFIYATEEDCFEINYPLTLVNSSGEISTVVNDISFEETLFVNENSELNIEFPITVTVNGTGEVDELSNVEALLDLFAGCE